MFKILIAILILTVALAVSFLGQIAVVVVGGIAFGLVLAEVVDMLGKDILAPARTGTAAPSRGKGREQGRERDEL
ncbi:hypothetical protein EKD04_025780 [Chloroflexales bacterium ZM16-3]|nr:hypothetical protein [Chloroflexales bacterium ZM16-3]